MSITLVILVAGLFCVAPLFMMRNAKITERILVVATMWLIIVHAFTIAVDMYTLLNNLAMIKYNDQILALISSNFGILILPSLLDNVSEAVVSFMRRKFEKPSTDTKQI